LTLKFFETVFRYLFPTSPKTLCIH
jgi:hypothetical protein